MLEFAHSWECSHSTASTIRSAHIARIMHLTPFDSNCFHAQEKDRLAQECNISHKQLVNWLTNARKRLWQPLRKKQGKPIVPYAQAKSAKRLEEISQMSHPHGDGRSPMVGVMPDGDLPNGMMPSNGTFRHGPATGFGNSPRLQALATSASALANENAKPMGHLGSNGFAEGRSRGRGRAGSVNPIPGHPWMSYYPNLAGLASMTLPGYRDPESNT